MLALEAANIFGWSDPITEVTPVDIKSFDGALFPDDERKKWMLLFNSAMASPGRIRFTQAHELGHYILHRQAREGFQCSNYDMLDWEEKTIEAQSDLFSSYLLMPLDDFRAQVTTVVDLELLGHCADRYGASLTAAVLKWIQYTEENAVLALSRDGYMQWAFSSRQGNRPGKSSSVAGSIVLRDCATMKLSPQCRSGTAGHHHPSQTRSKHFLVLSTIETLEIPFKRCWIT